MIQEITAAVLAAMAGWCWGYGVGSRHTREINERIVKSYKDAAESTWARFSEKAAAPHMHRWLTPHDCGDPKCHGNGQIVCAEQDCGARKSVDD